MGYTTQIQLWALPNRVLDPVTLTQVPRHRSPHRGGRSS
jgi:hypothetical protein